MASADTALGIDGYITKDTQTEHGTDYENILFVGQTVFKTADASGMTFKNCKFKAKDSEPYALAISGNWSNDLYLNFVNCDFEGFASAAVQPQTNTKYTNCVFHNMGADGGKVTSNGGYENCYFYNIGTTDGTHADGVQTTIENENFYIKNCRFDVVKNGNSGIFFYQEGNSKNAIIKDVLINGGNYSIYLGYKYPDKNDCQISDLTVENVKVGNAHQYGAFSCNAKKYSYLYDKGYISDQTELFVSSTSYDNGKIKLHVSNYTSGERTLVVKTDKITKEIAIPAHPSYSESQSLALSDLPIDLEYEVEGKWLTCYDTSESEDNQIRHVDYSDQAVEEDPVVPQTGTWQLKETTGKNYVILGTDDDNQGNTKFFRLLRSYGFPYTMNVEAENATSSRMLGSDVDTSIFTDSDAESLFPTNVSVIDFGKYLHDSGLGEVAQHGASDKTLWDSEKLTGDFLTSLYATYTEGGGNKSQDELKAAITEALKDTDGSQDASYVEETRDALKEAFGFPIKTVGIWGGAPSVVIDGVTLDLNSIKNTKNYDWRKHNYTAVCANLVKVFTNYSNPWDMPRIANDVGSVSSIIDTIPAGKACEFFWHAPFSDESDINVWRTLFSHIKKLVDSGKTEVITRSEYYELGEFVDNPISSIAVKSSVANVKVGDVVDTSMYTVTATYADGSTADVSKEAIVDASGVNTSQAGKYAVSASYRGFYATAPLAVIEAINYTVPEGLKNTDYWFVFKDNTNNTFYAGNTTGAFGSAYMSSGILAFIDCTAGTMNGWKSSDGQTWEQTDTDETHSKTIKTTSGEKIFDFGLAANDSITWLETSRNFEITYPY